MKERDVRGIERGVVLDIVEKVRERV